jgi:hypothetical protein
VGSATVVVADTSTYNAKLPKYKGSAQCTTDYFICLLLPHNWLCRRQQFKQLLLSACEEVPASLAGKAGVPANHYLPVRPPFPARRSPQTVRQSWLLLLLLLLLCFVQIDQLLSAREDINTSLAGKGKLSVNDFIVKAAALSCKKVPAINASWMGDFVRQYHNVDVNVAVASPAGLMVPFVRDADKKGLLAISEEVKGLAAKVRGVGQTGGDSVDN